MSFLRKVMILHFYRTVVTSTNSLTVYRRGVRLTFEEFLNKFHNIIKLSFSGCLVEYQMNYPGNDIIWGYHAQANNVASCQSYCRSTNNKYFTYRRSDGHCWCKSIVTTRTYHADLDSGEAICGIGKY